MIFSGNLGRSSALDDSPTEIPVVESAPRAIFVSDVHLGCRFCQADKFLEFLHQYQPEFLYLVGDILDGWRLRKSWYWLQSYTAIMQRLLDMAKAGTKIYYTPGNHDDFLRDSLDAAHFGNIVIKDHFIHELADGRRLLVMHGDQFDKVTSNHRWLSKLGDLAYNLLMASNRVFNICWGQLGGRPVGFSKFAKAKVKEITSKVSGFELALANHAKELDCHGVVCGHIHVPRIFEPLDGVWYYNSGDWVENRSALFEDQAGKLRIVEFD